MLFQGITEQFGALYFPHKEGVATQPSEGKRGDTESQFSNECSKHSPIPWPRISSQLAATGSLNFATHTFLLLSTIKRGTLEEAYTAKEIHDFGDVPAHNVQQYLKELVTQKVPNSAVEFKAPMKEKYQIATDHKCYSYECLVDNTGGMIFQVSVQKQPYRLLETTYGPDKVLRVMLADDPSPHRHRYQRLAEHGIFVALRRYQYWVHKETDKKGTQFKDKKVSKSIRGYFVCTASLSATDLLDPGFKPFASIADCRRHIMDIQTTETIAKYQSRLLLALSRTVKVDIDFKLRVEKDLQCKDANGRDLDVICTDGTGFISADLAMLVPSIVTRGIKQTSERNEVCPALLQVRIFRNGCAIKGTLGIDHRLPASTIVCRESMLKVKRDERPTNLPQIDSLELCNTSKSPHVGKLSRDLIQIASALGVPDSFFCDVIQGAINKMEIKLFDRASAWEEIRWITKEDAELARRMLGVGIPLREPFLHQTLMKLTSRGWADIKNGRVELHNSYNLIGTADPTGTLKRDEVAITLLHGPISGPAVAVYKNPGKFLGDVHKLKPTWNQHLQAAVGNSKYAIYFSTQGTRAAYEEIRNGDLDDDRYWICQHPDFLLHLQEWSERYMPRPVSRAGDTVKPADLPADELERRLWNQFVIAHQSRPYVGQAANYWSTYMDQYLTLDMPEQERIKHLGKAMEIGHMFNEAVNSVKSGIQVDSRRLKQLRPRQMPHYLGETSAKKIDGHGTYVNLEVKEVYHSTSILGQIFDMATQAESLCSSIPKEIELDLGFMFPNFVTHHKKWDDHFTTYRSEMVNTLNKKAPPGWSYLPTEDEIILKYKKILFGSVSSQEEWIRVLEESSAIYAVVYEKARYDLSARTLPRLSFAWKVAGYPLCEIYHRNQLPTDPLCTMYLENQPRVPFLFSYKAYNDVLRREVD